MTDSYSWTAAAAQQRDETDVPNAEFWPGMNVAEFCRQYAVPGALDNAMIKNALIVAAAQTNRRLEPYKQRALDADQTGFVYWGTTDTGTAVSVDMLDPETLADIPADTIAENSVLVAQYYAAVYSTAMARLIMMQPMQSDDDRATVAAQYTATATAAVAEINGEPATGVYLI
ncbi:head completion/stabilization protein [Oceanobacter sp. 4_MG-2023]|uniref:head completion/stabilization protein n=1 Tax=Oceanobacter sp. 4_MG-2023 TaxID=3062623 RepID=UPI00273649DC|nr:head completion/stabilization protein [Oceanobacter sp. 4_MG-2023]MDP2548892.1 head completion/stabilization protein [Oceanobacter sp. 4_MG-2023]